MTENHTKPVILSGIQPSGELMIGNYIGAIKNWVNLQADYDCFFMLVDLHAITVKQDPATLRNRCYDFLALYMACGLSPENNTIFVQSHVPGHSQLMWLLNCITPMGDLNRMTQFKDKSKKHEKNLNAGLFNYPVLMAADILLYNADLVPVGEDQKQHLELARNIAQKFNNEFGEVFKVPEPYIAKSGARIMSLQDPSMKMSKSDPNPNSFVSLLDDPKKIAKKIKKAVTDSGTDVKYDESKPAIANLMTIRQAITGESFETMETAYEGKGYGHFKVDLAEQMVEFIAPIQGNYKAIREDLPTLNKHLANAANVARERAEPMLKRVHEAVGFIME